MVVENPLQFLTAIATIMIALAAFYQLRESRKERQRNTRLKVLKYLYTWRGRIIGNILNQERILNREHHSWGALNIQDDIERNTVEFHSLRNNIQTKLRTVVEEYEKLRTQQEQPNRASLDKLINSAEDLKKLIEKKIDSLISDLGLDRI